MLQEKSATFQVLRGHKYMILTTFRKNGQAVSTPVWFADVEDHLYVLTMPKAGKVKRLHHNAQVEVAPCDVSGNVLGETVEAMGMVLPPSDFKRADAALSKKYGISKMLYLLMWRLQGIRPVFLEITPM